MDDDIKALKTIGFKPGQFIIHEYADVGKWPEKSFCENVFFNANTVQNLEIIRNELSLNYWQVD